MANGTLDDVAELTLISSGADVGTDPITVEDQPELTGNLAATITVKRDGSDSVADEVVSASHSTYTVKRAISQYEETPVSSGVTGFSTLFGVGDADKDGSPDLLGWKTTGEIVIFYGDGAGGFSNPSGTVIDTVSTSAYKSVIPVGDWNNDGYVDYAVQNNSLNFYLRKGKSDGTFETSDSQNVANISSAKRAYFWPGDWDADGKQDFMLVETDDTLRFRKGAGGGLAASPVDSADPSDASKNIFADFDGDGHTDVANHQATDDWYASYSGTGAWWLLAGSQYGASQVRFDGDFDGNGQADMAMQHSGAWRVAWNTTGGWEPLNSYSGTSHLYFVNIDHSTDGSDDFVEATGSQVRYKAGGTGSWTSGERLRTSRTSISPMWMTTARSTSSPK